MAVLINKDVMQCYSYCICCLTCNIIIDRAVGAKFYGIGIVDGLNSANRKLYQR